MEGLGARPERIDVRDEGREREGEADGRGNDRLEESECDAGIHQQRAGIRKELAGMIIVKKLAPRSPLCRRPSSFVSKTRLIP